MEWLLAFALAVSLIALMSARTRLQSALAANSDLLRKTDWVRTADNALALSVLSREVANEIMQRDAVDYERRFGRLYGKWKEIETLDRKAKRAHADAITSKYVRLADFDELNTKPHVLYADGFSWMSDDDLWDLYESMRLYDALRCELEGQWRMHSAGITESELEHVREYSKKLGDTNLLAHLHKAREQLIWLENEDTERAHDGDWDYETRDYMIKRIAHVAESRWGVYVKSMDRYGMWGLFVDEKAYTSFYAADKDFNEQQLDNLNIRFCVEAREYDRIEKMEW